MKKFLLLFAVAFNCIMGGTMAFAMGGNPVIGAVGMNAVGAAASFVPGIDALRSGVYVEVWIGEIIKQFTHAMQNTFLDGVPDYSQYSQANVLHLVEAGVNPDVVINNTTYPLTVQDLADGDKAISLDKFQTKPTSVTDDELYAISYDKISLKKEQHGNAIVESELDKAIHAFAPAANTAATPVIAATGEYDGTRRRLTRKDVITLKNKFDKMKVPQAGRRLVLCPDHVQDLLLQDQTFANQYYNYGNGVITRMYGFDIYEYVNCPLYTTAGAKKSYGAVASTGEFQASVAFYVPRMFKATGDTTMYYSEAKTDPTNQRNLLAFRSYFVALPQKNEAIGAIYSPYNAE